MEYQGTSTDGYTAREMREIDSARSFSRAREKEMADLIKEVNEMGWFEKFMEAKIPNEKKRFWMFFTVKVADPVVLRQEIAKHKKLYEEIEEALRKARNRDENAGEAMEDIYEKLMQVYHEDKLKIANDDCKTLCDLHQNFVAGKDKLENSIRRVENAHSRMELSRTQKKLDAAMDKVDDLVGEVRQSEMRCRNLLDKTKMLMEQNEQLLDRQEKLEEELEKTRHSYMSLEEMFGTVLAKKNRLEQELERGQISYRSLEEKFDMVLRMNKHLIEREGEKEAEWKKERVRIDSTSNPLKKALERLGIPIFIILLLYFCNQSLSLIFQ